MGLFTVLKSCRMVTFFLCTGLPSVTLYPVPALIDMKDRAIVEPPRMVTGHMTLEDLLGIQTRPL